MNLEKTMNLCTYSFIENAILNKASKEDKFDRIVFIGKKTSLKKVKGLLLDWQYQQLLESKDSIFKSSCPKGNIILIRPWLETNTVKRKADINSPSFYSQSRDLSGKAFSYVNKKVNLQLDLYDLNKEQTHGSLVGIEIASYTFKNMAKRSKELPQLSIQTFPTRINKKTIEQASALGTAVNLSRHLVNLPANILNPDSYSDFMLKLFKPTKYTTVNIWDKKKLKQENMNLMLSVGAASETPPCLVHIKYRPPKTKGAPIAFVGKGITFDTGGLNVKTGNYMRMMKKDMGGSASVAALCYWAAKSGLKKNCDFYLALAENSISDKAIRPGDIMYSRSGLSVEMDNTDAEGRLVLADALDVAATSKDKPQKLINLATLTGATRVAVGYDVAGLYSNSPKLSDKIAQSSYDMGDPTWPLPLVQNYKKQLKSNIADMANSSNGMGGGIRAALFLESFVKDIDWAHLDMYAWKNSVEGPYLEAGASGQAVQCLSHYLS